MTGVRTNLIHMHCKVKRNKRTSKVLQSWLHTCSMYKYNTHLFKVLDVPEEFCVLGTTEQGRLRPEKTCTCIQYVLYFHEDTHSQDGLDDDHSKREAYSHAQTQVHPQQHCGHKHHHPHQLEGRGGIYTCTYSEM